MTSTPNKNYPLQSTGTNVGTWGTVLNNGALSVIDNNIGGTLNISVAGNSNINLTASQASFLIHNLTGALTGNINYIFPALGGFFAVNNQTTGAYTVTVTVVGGSGGIVVPQGNTVSVYIDATVPQVEAFTGTQYVFTAGTVTGTANALIVAQTFPSSFTLSNGTLITFTPTALNTTSATLNVADTGNKTIKKIGSSGLVNLAADDLATGSPILAQYNGTYWIALNILYYGVPVTLGINTEIDFTYLFVPVVCTAAITLTLDATSTLGPIFKFEVLAKNGAVTLAPNASDSIMGGTTGANYTIPSGASGSLYNDGAGNWYVNYIFSLDSLGSAQGDILYRNASAWTALTPGTSGQFLKTQGASANPVWATMPSTSVVYNSISGCLLSSITGNATTATISVGSGQASDSGNTVYITSAGYSWAASNGNAINGYSGGTTLPNSSTIHMYLCTGASGTGTYAIPNSSYPLSAGSAPTGYTTAVRRIGSFSTTGSGAPIPYTSNAIGGGSIVNWFATLSTDINVSNLSTSRTSFALSTPLGIVTQPIGRTGLNTNASTIIFSSLNEPASAPSAFNGQTTSPGWDLSDGPSLGAALPFVLTNTSAQIGAIANQASTNITLFTRGYIDFRIT